jgi:hypothetical protein
VYDQALRTKVHPLFQAALDGMHAPYVRHEAIHLDGPPPLLGAREQVQVALWAAEQLNPAPASVPALILETIRELLAGRVGASQVMTADRILSTNRWQADEPQIVVAMAGAAARHLLRRPRNTARAARAAISHAVRLVERGGARAFLEGLDEAILRAEFAMLCRRHGGADAADLLQVVYRAGGPTMNLDVHVSTLAGDRVGAFVRLGGRLAWEEGTRDDILAAVPDDHFPSVTHALFRSRR